MEQTATHAPSYFLSLPGEEDQTQTALHALPSRPAQLDEYPTLEMRPMPGPAAPQCQTERMAPYRSEAPPRAGDTQLCSQSKDRFAEDESFGTAPLKTEQGTEIMAPFRPVAPRAPRLVPTPVGAVTTPAEGLPVTQTDNEPTPIDTDTTTCATPITRAARTTQASSLTAPSEAVSVRTSPPARSATTSPERSVSFLAKLGLLAKARPFVVAAGGTAGSVMLMTVLLAAPRLAEHVRPRKAAQPALEARGASPVLPASTPVKAAARATAPVRVVSAGRCNSVSSPNPGDGNGLNTDVELRTAMSALVTGRYSDARVAYAALSDRSCNSAIYATVSRLLAQAADVECGAASHASPRKCPEIRR